MYIVGSVWGLYVLELFLIRNKRLMKDEGKLKEARLQVTDERNIEIGSRALRMAAFVLLIVMYFAFLLEDCMIR